MRALCLCCVPLLLLAACGGSVEADRSDDSVAVADQADTADPAGSTDRAAAGDLPVLVDGFLVSLGVDEFLLSPSTLVGEEIAAAMAATGDRRWVPWLVDLLRLGRSTSLDRQAADALAALTGLEATHRRVDDLVAFGGWMYDHAPDPGTGYAAWKIRLYERIDPEFRLLLGQVGDPIVLSRIQFGGVVRGGIPELDLPERLTIDQARHMQADEIVYGTELGGVEVAYPLRIIGHHELANDVVGGLPVAMVFCTLCRTAVLFDRRVDGRELSFETSGLLVNSNKVMVDRQTDTLWNQLTGEAFAGPLAGTTLTRLSSVAARWSDWVADHPDSLTLDFPASVVFDDPERAPISYEYEPGAVQSSYYESDDVWFPIFDTPDVFALKDEVLTVQFDGGYLAVGLEALAAHGPLVLQVGDGAVLVVPSGAGGRIYDATAAVGGGELSVGGAVVLGRSGTTPEAVTLASGTVLPRVLGGQSFWFAWYGQHPDTAWWPVGGQ